MHAVNAINSGRRCHRSVAFHQAYGGSSLAFSAMRRQDGVACQQCGAHFQWLSVAVVPHFRIDLLADDVEHFIVGNMPISGKRRQTGHKCRSLCPRYDMLPRRHDTASKQRTIAAFGVGTPLRDAWGFAGDDSAHNISGGLIILLRHASVIVTRRRIAYYAMKLGAWRHGIGVVLFLR